MNNDIERDFNLGGTVEQALSGQYQLKISDVFKEAWSHTIKHFLSFSPAIVMLIVIQLAIFFIALKLQIGDLSIITDVFDGNAEFPEGLGQAIFIANFSYEVVSAPIYAGISLMAMSHAAGLATRTRHITKGLQFTVPVIIATLCGLLLQLVSSQLLPILSMYISLAFSNSVLLICEKHVSPLQALWLSLRAVNKKLLQIAVIYALLMMMFVAAVLFYGIGLIFVLPFFFHVKGIIYRNMFGIRLKIVTSDHNNDDDQQNKNPQVFDA